ncbi:phage major tail protein, TP901-1 family [Jeotgalibacillus proteolyticus]|uniref:Phage major tail protein, TP901-1 family n=1 Tax=Jeotgalibacillus proteolyticus TaxID=2082395 RepID=A0A2S5GAM2_9BACL|nr:phage major tail protein, TP901-1 family [Jeotgalibacillus proteolyticus]PPA70036.1 phage major tail protein, TP901-1 family [Jeotgalibacillus proteolyticus]
MEQGKDWIYIVQSESAPLGAPPLAVGHQTEGTFNRGGSIIDEQTKFGRALGYGPKEQSFEITAYAEVGDSGQTALEDAYDNEEQLKVWRVYTKPNANGAHTAYFAYTIIENIDVSDPTDGFAELSVTLPIMLQAQKSELPELPADLIAFAQYGFEAPGETTGAFPNQTSEAPAG